MTVSIAKLKNTDVSEKGVNAWEGWLPKQLSRFHVSYVQQCDCLLAMLTAYNMVAKARLGGADAAAEGPDA